MAESRQVELQWQWRTTLLTRTLVTCAALALAAAVVSGRWQLVVFAAPMLGVLASIGWQRPLPPMSVRSEPAQLRCFEGEHSQTVVELVGGSGSAELEVTAVPGMQTDVLTAGTAARQSIAARADRWGRYPLRAAVRAVAPGGLLCASATAEVAEVFVFPTPPTASTALPRTAMPDRIGTHLTRYAGSGVEYADIRPYVPGDQLRSVNWAVSARRGALHVTERLTDRAVDVVVLVDLSAQPPGPATAATQRTVEGAVQVVQSALRSGDRAGLVGLGGRRPRWLGPDVGQRQFYRVLDTVLELGGYHQVSGTLAPRVAIPPGAIVVAFSTLLDSDFGLALNNLYERGHVVVVIDVLHDRPFDCSAGERQDVLLGLMWDLQRSAKYRNMRSLGVNVLPWPADVPLEQVMRGLPGTGRR